jgi:hypothetical protein
MMGRIRGVQKLCTDDSPAALVEGARGNEVPDIEEKLMGGAAIGFLKASTFKVLRPIRHMPCFRPIHSFYKP